MHAESKEWGHDMGQHFGIETLGTGAVIGALSVVTLPWMSGALAQGNGHQDKTPDVALGVDDLESLRERLAPVVEGAWTASGAPGVSVALVLPDGREVALAAGLASREPELAMSPEHRMPSGSIGKIYFAAAALEQVHAGALDLDAPVSEYLADFEGFDRLPNASTMLVRHLMRHESGLPRYVMKRAFWDKLLSDPDKDWAPGDQLEFVLGDEPVHPAGEGWAYSDTNYILLGMILEGLTEESAYATIQGHFLAPHGLEDTIPLLERRIPGVAQGYTRMFQAFGLPEEVVDDGAFRFQPSFEYGGGGFAQTPLDLARWARIGFAGKAFEGQSIDLMIDGAHDASAFLGGDTHYGLGVMIRTTEQGVLLGHDGSWPGYTSSMGYFADHDIGAAIQFNSDVRTSAHEVLGLLCAEALAWLESESDK